MTTESNTLAWTARRTRRAAAAGIVLAILTFSGVSATAHDHIEGLPEANYHARPDDPAWLRQAAQFHGHLGPWIVTGVRLGRAAVSAAGAEGFFDVEVTVEGPFDKPPKSCLIDGVQLSTGATLGKRNIRWLQGEAIVVRVKNTRTGRVVETRPAAKVLAEIASLPPPKPASAVAPAADAPDSAAAPGSAPMDTSAVEAVARSIAALPDAEAVAVKVVEPGR